MGCFILQKYKLLISYDGTRFAGWQVQKNSTTIQPLVQKAIETVLRHPISLFGSGRTDAGVHALGQVAHFETEIEIDAYPFLLSINALLPVEIRVHKVEKVECDFHARYSALSKIYHYHLHLDPYLSPFTHLYRTHIRYKCDLELLCEARMSFLGTHDFSSFANQHYRGSASHDPVRTIYRIDIVPQEGGVRLEFEANGFLYKMVRNITGTLLDVGAGRVKMNQIEDMFKAKDRKAGGTSAPAQGLFLMEVKYPLKNESGKPH